MNDTRKGILIRAPKDEWKQIKIAALNAGMTLQDYCLQKLLESTKPDKPAQDNLDVAAIRNRIGLSQSDFAARLGIPLATLRNWEQGHRSPNAAARALLSFAAKAGEAA